MKDINNYYQEQDIDEKEVPKTEEENGTKFKPSRGYWQGTLFSLTVIDSRHFINTNSFNEIINPALVT